MLEDRTCLVTGASRGIGRAIAEELGQQGAEVVVNYRSSEAEAEATAETIEDAGGTAMTAQADISEYEQVETMRKAVHNRLGGIDVWSTTPGSPPTGSSRR